MTDDAAEIDAKGNALQPMYLRMKGSPDPQQRNRPITGFATSHGSRPAVQSCSGWFAISSGSNRIWHWVPRWPGARSG